MAETHVTPRRNPSRAWGGFSNWLDERTVRDPKLATPARHMWRDYKTHCELWGFEPATAPLFMRWLGEAEGVVIRQAGLKDENVVSGLVLTGD